MPFRYFVKQLLLPPGILLLLLALGWWLRRTRPRLAGLCFALGLGGFWLMSLPIVVQWSANALERVPPLAREEWATLGQRADAIVVLGSGRERGDPAHASTAPTPAQLTDCSWVANRWCELLPLPLAHKQQLMELDNPLIRLELVGDFLTQSGIAR